VFIFVAEAQPIFAFWAKIELLTHTSAEFKKKINYLYVIHEDRLRLGSKNE